MPIQPITRRRFVGGLGAVAGATMSRPAGATPAQTPTHASAGEDARVAMWGDGIALQPTAYASLLARLTADAGPEADRYLLGGAIAQFEQRWAALLGKEAAIFMPSGTLANQLALRALAGERRRVVVPEMSHVHNDTGDACQTLSGLTLLPLGAGRAGFDLDEIEATLARTASGRVAAEVGAILIESPVRRRAGELFDRDAMLRIAAFAGERGIGLHLDGARLFVASAYTGIAPAEYAAPFDTVYVSLWKCFNSGIGAILAGPRRLLEGMHHARRMFGGNLWQGWPAALVAQHYMDGFIDRLRNAIGVSEAFYAGIADLPGIRVEPVANGTNVRHLHLEGIDADRATARLAERGIDLPPVAPDGRVSLTVNETWNRRSAAELIAAFAAATG